MAPARLGPRSDGRIHAAANEAKIFARSASGRAWATSTIRAVSMSASAAPEAARPATKTAMVGRQPRHDLGHDEGGHPPQQHRARAGAVGPAAGPRHRDGEGDQGGAGGGPEQGPAVELAHHGRQDRADRAVLEGREGHQRDDADDDRQVRAGEQPHRAPRAGVGGSAVGVAVPEVVMIPILKPLVHLRSSRLPSARGPTRPAHDR